MVAVHNFLKSKEFLFLILFLLLFQPCSLLAVNIYEGDKLTEIPVNLKIRNIGELDFIVLGYKKNIYYPVEELFGFLRINCQKSPDGMQYSGFFINRDSLYRINLIKNEISYLKRRITLSDTDYIVKNNVLYLISHAFEIFGVSLKYNPRLLTVRLKTYHILPAQAELQRKKNRERILREREFVFSAHSYDLEYLLLEGNNFDWRFTTYAQRNRPVKYNYYVGLGNKIFTSDLVFKLTGQSKKSIRDRDWTGYWRFPIYDTDLIRQVVIGDLYVPENITFGLTRGIEITNRPPGRRITQAREEISVQFPNIKEIEFYRGGGLSNFIENAIDSLYTFETNLYYGISDYEFRLYDEWGGVQRSRIRYYVPYTMLPKKEFQYSIRFGRLFRFKNQLHGTTRLEYGATDRITLGTDLNYMESKDVTTKLYPGVFSTFRLTTSLISTFYYSPFYQAFANLHYTAASDAHVGMTHTFYHRFSPFNLAKMIDKYSIYLRSPQLLRRENSYGDYGLVLSIDSEFRREEKQNVFSAYPRVSMYAGRVQLVLSNSYYESYPKDKFEIARRNWSSGLNLLFKLRGGIYLSTSLNYNHIGDKLKAIGAQLMIPFIENLFIFGTFDRYFHPSLSHVSLNIQYLFPFMRYFGRYGKYGEQPMYTAQSIQGNIISSRNFMEIGFDNIHRLEKGVAQFRPFLDENNNLLKEANENYLENIKLRPYFVEGYLGGPGVLKPHGLVYRSVSPYQNYSVIIPEQAFENYNWIPYYPAITAMIEPNTYNIFNIPIVVGGTLKGSVKRFIDGQYEPVQGLTVRVTRIDARLPLPREAYKKSTLTFSTGEFAFYGLISGTYEVSLDEEELKSAGYKARVISKEVTIEFRREGDEKEVEFIIDKIGSIRK